MSFVTADDFKPYIKEGNLTRMIEDDDTVLDMAIETATATVRDSLYQYYDTDEVWSLAGNDRPKHVVRWIVVLTLYYLYERLPSSIMPQRVKDNYEEVCAWLKDIEDGKKPLDLPRVAKPDGSGPVSKFRWGASIPPRSHDI